jgi:Fic family protein
MANAIVDVDTRVKLFQELTWRVRSEYEEMPGLNLTMKQAQRLWGADRQTCESVFSALLESRFLKRTKGRFVRA